MKICRVGAELFRADGRAGRRKDRDGHDEAILRTSLKVQLVCLLDFFIRSVANKRLDCASSSWP